MTTILVYGTLRNGHGLHYAMKDATYLRDVRIPGYDMVNLGGCPGIIENKDNRVGIFGEVYDVDQNTLDMLDNIEGYNPERPDRPGYCRRFVSEDAQAYVWTRPRNEWTLPIPSGDWSDR